MGGFRTPLSVCFGCATNARPWAELVQGQLDRLIACLGDSDSCFQIEGLKLALTGAKDLLNNRMAYVAVSRGAHDARIFTSDREKLPQALSRDVSQQSAHAPELKPQTLVEPKEKVYTPADHERHQAPMREVLEPEDATEFKWKGETGTIQTYQHTETGLKIHIDGKGQFYSQDLKPTSKVPRLTEQCRRAVLHSQNEYENSLGVR